MGQAVNTLVSNVQNNANNSGGTPIEVSSLSLLINALNELDTANDNSTGIIGDSRALRNLNGTSQWGLEGDVMTANILMGQKFDIQYITGLSGFSVDNIAPAVANMINQKLKNIFCYVGTNNITGADTAATVASKILEYIIKPFLNAGSNVFMMTIVPFTGLTGDQAAKIRTINTALRNLSFTNPRLFVIDLARGLTDATSGIIGSTLSQDLLHNNARGGFYGAQEVVPIAGAMPFKARQIGSGDALDPAIISSNPLLLGNNATATNGTEIGTGATGTGPSSWGIKTNNVRTTVTVLGGVARTDKVNGSSMSLTCSWGADDDSVIVQACPLGASADIDCAKTWTASSARAYGQLTIRSNGVRDFQFKCITIAGGTTGSVEPVWPTSIGSIIVDNNITWMCIPDTIGNYYEVITDFMLTAFSGTGFLPTHNFGINDTGFSGSLRTNLRVNRADYPFTSSNAWFSPTGSLGTPQWDTPPLNQVMTMRSQPFSIPALTRHIAASMRFFAKNATTATIVILRSETRLWTP